MNKKNFESGHITRHCEFVRTWQSDEIASHSFAMARERGRTLVEMLSTLAIMGILTVAGVAAYNSAMNRYRANTLISEAQKRAVVVAGQIGFNGREPSLAEFNPPNPTSGGTFGDVTTEGLYKQFGIEVSGVKKPVCQNILNTIGASTPIRRLSLAGTPTTPITSCEESNDFLFIYNEDMQGKSSDTEYATDESSCKSVCGVFNPKTHLCDESDCEIPTNTCTVDTDCNTENECMVCDTTTQACKNGCERVEYLKSTGTQYINTGVIPTNNMEFFTKIRFNSDQYLAYDVAVLASRNATTRYQPIFGYQAKWAIGIGGDYDHNGKSMAVDTDYDIYSVVTSGVTIQLYVDGVRSSTKTSYSGVGIPSIPMYYMARNMNNDTQLRCKMRSYYLKIYVDATLALDFIPVLSPESSKGEGKPCMFDKVTKKLFCNAGSGTFEYGSK